MIMKRNIIYIFLATALFSLLSCGEHNHSHDEAHKTEGSEGNGHQEEHESILSLNERQRSILKLRLGPLESREMGTGIAVNGVLEIPPQSQASVSSYIGANVRSIHVIEGDKVDKGQILASLSHPDLVNMQMAFLEAEAEKQFQEKEFKRKKTLFDEAVISGGKFQKAEAAYKSAVSKWKARQHKLKMLGLDIEKISNGEIIETLYLKSPIEGFVRMVEVTLGKYVSPNEELFEIVNNDHIHADLMVYEKDIYRVAEGQKVHFSVGNRKDMPLEARIFSIGKSFEEEPKAVHLHAEIDSELKGLIPGMYVQGTILTEKESLMSLPEAAIVEENGRHYAFIREASVKKEEDNDQGENTWTFRKIEVMLGVKDSGYIAVQFPEKLDASSDFVLNAAYYLLAEMNKAEAAHVH